MLRRAGLLAALTALLVPAVAGTTANAKTRAPVVTRITPKHVDVGETLTIRGHHFRRGLNKNTVAFKRAGAKVVFVKAEIGTTQDAQGHAAQAAREGAGRQERHRHARRRSRLRVLSSRFGKRFTSRAKSPVVGPEKPPAPPKPVDVDPNADCDGDGIVNRVDTDDDNDLLSDTLEKLARARRVQRRQRRRRRRGRLRVPVGQGPQRRRGPERRTTYLPYPTKKPYPNPLDGTDADTDYDGDTLSLLDEYKLWKYTIAHGAARTLTPLTYSAGEQFSVNARGNDGRRTPSLAAAGYAKQAQFLSWAGSHGYANVMLSPLGNTAVMNFNVPEWWEARTSYDIRDMDRSGAVSGAESTYYDDGNGLLDDAERDEDADGLDNQWEASGCLSGQKYWSGVYTKETKYYLSFAGTDLVDGDTDGDGVLDGADDQDHDDIPNVMECSRSMALGNVGYDAPDYDPATAPARPWKGMVNPFNPCLPHPKSRTCKQYVEVGGSVAPWAPFNANEADSYYLIRN